MISSLYFFSPEIPELNFVVNYNFPTTNTNLSKWYCDHLTYITSNDAFVINIITAASYMHVPKLVEILLEMNQASYANRALAIPNFHYFLSIFTANQSNAFEDKRNTSARRTTESCGQNIEEDKDGHEMG
jgi:hypothetical protein